MDYIAAIESSGRAPKTVKNYKTIVERLWNRLGERMFDLPALNTYLDERGFVPGTRATYLWAVSAALGDAPGRELFERAAGLATGESRSLSEKQRRTAQTVEKLAPVIGEYEVPFDEMIEKAQRVIDSGFKEDKNGVLKKVPDFWIQGYKSFVIDCKMKSQGAPPRSDFCSVYSSKSHADAAGDGGSYYDRETGCIIFTSRVKDPRDVKENLPFDVSGIRDELNKFVDSHGHRKLLAREMEEPDYNSWIGDRTKQFGRCRMGTTVQRKMYENKPVVRAAIEETAEREARMGHTNRTSDCSYKLPTAAFEAAVARKREIENDPPASESGKDSDGEKENEEPGPKRAKLEDEKTALENEAENFADDLMDDMVYEDEIDGVSRF